MQNRRTFLEKLSVALLAASSFSFSNPIKSKRNMKNVFVHHVYFWLKNADNKDDQKKLIKGLEKLSAVATIQKFHIGVPANTHREVIDSSYAISWLVIFSNEADQASYQKDPIHLKFIEECASLWNKVTVYDSVDASH